MSTDSASEASGGPAATKRSARPGAKTALVTGSTDGVGRRVAQRLAATGMHVIVHGRDLSRGRALLHEIDAAGEGSAEFIAADFASLAEARRLATLVDSKYERLHLLINNAGIGTAAGGAARRTSGDGVELRFAVNHLAGFVLTEALLTKLKRSAPSRIVMVASAGQMPLDFNNPMLERGYNGMRAYCQSKLAQITYGMELAERLAGTGVTVNSLHPATYMDTTMVRESGVAPMSTVEEGAEAILNLALGAAFDTQTGLYFDGLEPAKAHAQAYKAEDRQQLKELSLKLAKL